MTPEEADLVAARVVALLGPRLDAIEATVREDVRAGAAVARAVGRLRDQAVIAATADATRHEEHVRVFTTQATELRDLGLIVRGHAPPGPAEPDPVGEEVVKLKAGSIANVRKAIDGAVAAPGRAIAWADKNRWAAGAFVVAVAQLAFNLADGTPLLVALGRALLSVYGAGAPSPTPVPGGDTP